MKQEALEIAKRQLNMLITLMDALYLEMERLQSRMAEVRAQIEKWKKQIRELENEPR